MPDDLLSHGTPGGAARPSARGASPDRSAGDRPRSGPIRAREARPVGSRHGRVRAMVAPAGEPGFGAAGPTVSKRTPRAAPGRPAPGRAALAAPSAGHPGASG
ncbi:hypothetical protein Shyhy01_31760 [Streptomyces hygroscopicus subsp. hygroscopicus]|nr:hypothetical protein Shyhy01_31760 [Streptomyces hygroscopicus subsp. hygroscopicus]